MTVSVQEEEVGRPQQPRPAQGRGTLVAQEEGGLVQFGTGPGGRGGVRTDTPPVAGGRVQLGTRPLDRRRLVQLGIGRM